MVKSRAARITLAGALALSMAALPLGAFADSGPWPQFHGTAQHTGQSATIGPRSLTLAWYRAASDDVNSSPAISGDGTVYMSSAEGGVAALTLDGAVKWTYSGGTNNARIAGSPVLANDGRIIIGDLLGRIRALNPSDGTIAWTTRALGSIRSTAAVAPEGTPSAGTIYMGTDNGQLIGLDTDGKEVFRAHIDSTTAILAAPAIAPNGDLFWGGLDGRLRRSTRGGDQIWAVSLDGPIVSSPAIGADGTVYVGAGGSFEAVDPASGAVKWSAGLGGDVKTTAAIAPDGTLYVGSDSGALRAISPQGVTKWTAQTGGAVRSSAAVGGDGLVYFGSGDALLYVYDANGQRVATYRALDAIEGAAAITPDGNVLFGSKDNRLYALKDTARQFKQSPADRLGGDVVRDPATGRVYVIVDGRRRFIPDPETQQILGLVAALPTNLTSSELLRYPEGAPLPALTEGSLIQAANGPIYVVRSGKRAWIRTLDEFVSGGYAWDAVIPVDDRVLRSVPLAVEDGLLVKGVGDRVYVVENGQKRWISSPAAFAGRGYTWSMVHMVTDATLAALPEGAQI